MKHIKNINIKCFSEQLVRKASMYNATAPPPRYNK